MSSQEPHSRIECMRQTFALLLTATCLPVWAAQPVRARHGMVVSRERHATETGLQVLKNGGNAIDAAAAVGLALAVTHPSAGNLGGGGFMLIRLADGRTTFIDFRERAPAKANRDMYLDSEGHPTKESDIGYRASGVPGTVRGFELAQGKYGRKTWSDVIEPAWRLASKGFVVSYGLAEELKSKPNRERLGEFSESKRVFLRSGRFYEAGEVFRQPELGRTLKRLIKAGARDFYEGETAHLIAADMDANGGLISVDDLKQYKAVERTPLSGSYRDYSIITAPPPSSGGLGILYILSLLEPIRLQDMGAGSALATHYMTESMRRYFADRSYYLGDPDFYSVPCSALLDPKYIAARRQTIDGEKATPSSAIAPGRIPADEGKHTTHYSIVDAA